MSGPAGAVAPARPRAALAWVGPLTFAVHALGAHPDRLGMWGDDAIYQAMADALRRGGPLVADVLPSAPGVQKYPLGWPATIAALEALGASVNGVLLVNAALWALTVQLVVSVLLPACGARLRVCVLTGLVLSLDTLTMDLVPQLMSEPSFTLALTAAAVLVVRGGTRRGELAALALCAAVAAGTRTVGGLYAGLGGLLLGIAGRRALGGALLAGTAFAGGLGALARACTVPPTGDALEVLRYYVSYDVHTGWYLDRWAAGGPAAVLGGLATVAGANVRFGPESLGLFVAPTAWSSADSAGAPGTGTELVGLAVLALAALGALRAPRARPLAVLLALHALIFLAWTWPFSSRFWLPLVPVLVGLAVFAIDGLGDVGRLALVPVVGLVVALNAIQPAYAARAAVWGPDPDAAAEAAAADAPLDAAIAALRARVHPGDVLAGESYVFWLARPLGASAVELRNLVPFAEALPAALHLLPGPDDVARQGGLFAANLRRLRAITPPSARVWVAYEPRRREPKRDWIRRAQEAGLLADEGEFGLMHVLSVSAAPGTN